MDDPYRWLPTLGDMDLHLIGEGRHEKLWEVLGAHVRARHPGGPVTGTAFAVWAPNARGVRVTGDFDHWAGDGYPMRSLGSSGVWELFVPGVGEGTRYKFRSSARTACGGRRPTRWPSPPRCRRPPRRWCTRRKHEWNDAEWMARARAERQLHARPLPSTRSTSAPGGRA